MCIDCSPRLRELPPQPARRPKTRAGTHAPAASAERLEALCNGAPTRVWWTRAGIRCVACWHLLEPAFHDDLSDRLRNRFRQDIEQRNNLIADDLDDSEEGLKAMADQLHEIHPYLRLQLPGRRSSLFRITTGQHRLIELDTSTLSLAERTRKGAQLNDKITIELDTLLEAATK